MIQTSNTYQLLILLQKVEEGKLKKEEVREVLEWKLRTTKKNGLDVLTDIKIQFKELEDIFTPVILNMMNDIINKEETEKELKNNVVNMNITHSIEDLTKTLRVTRKTIYNYMDKGKLEYVQLGENKRVVTQEQLNKFLKK